LKAGLPYLIEIYIFTLKIIRLENNTGVPVIFYNSFINNLYQLTLFFLVCFGAAFSVLRAIENLNIPEEFKLHNFVELSHQVLGGTQKYYIISR
jgi:hypothetical protein